MPNHFYEQNPFLNLVFYSRCHLPSPHLLKKKKKSAPNTCLFPFHFLVHFNQVCTLNWNYSCERWQWLLNVKSCAFFSDLILCDIFFFSEAMSIDTLITFRSFWLLLLYTCCWLHFCLCFRLRYSPCSVFSSNSSFLPCHT